MTASQTARGRTPAVAVIISILATAAIFALVITIIRNSQLLPDGTGPVTETVAPDQAPSPVFNDRGPGSQPTRHSPFRFPDDPVHTGKQDLNWRVLGWNPYAWNNRKKIFGYMPHRILHFTFDDGPVSETTPRLLDLLSAYNIRATFFVIGKYLFGPDAPAHSELIRKMEKAGHTVAIHSYTHKDFRGLSTAQVNRELYRSGRLLESILGYHPGLFRPPYGGSNPRTRELLHDRGYTEILWNIAPEEYGARNPREILGNFQAALDRQEEYSNGPGGIVLLHDSRATTVMTFPLLMGELRRRNCAILHQDGEELWDVVGDLQFYLVYENEPPSSLIEQRQTLARRAAVKYCAERRKPQT